MCGWLCKVSGTPNWEWILAISPLPPSPFCNDNEKRKKNPSRFSVEVGEWKRGDALAYTIILFRQQCSGWYVCLKIEKLTIPAAQRNAALQSAEPLAKGRPQELQQLVCWAEWP